MQLARNLFLSSERSFGRKLQEIFLTIQIERRFTKPQTSRCTRTRFIWGTGVYGFEGGSEFYFSKHMKDLTLAEARCWRRCRRGRRATRRSSIRSGR